MYIMDFIFSSVKYWVVNHLSKKPIFSTLEYLLVSNPKIQNFSWNPSRSLGSSPLFLAITVLSYLSLTFLLAHVNLPTMGPRLLKSIIAVHNMILLVLSFFMVLGSTLSIIYCAPNVEYMFCFPKNTLPKGPLFFWAYIFYLSKIYECMDTLLIILSNSKKRLTFLHVYHHAAIMIVCYISLYTSQSMFPLVVVGNGSVHVMMYFYYLQCSLGARPKWKKLVTDIQIAQFSSSFGFLGFLFYYHFTGLGCSGIWGWCFHMVFITSLLLLFIDFHSKTYSEKTRDIKDV